MSANTWNRIAEAALRLEEHLVADHGLRPEQAREHAHAWALGFANDETE